VTGAYAVAGNFSKNDRIANAIGIPAETTEGGQTIPRKILLRTHFKFHKVFFRTAAECPGH
jgi:hypothetical protein